MTSQLKLVFSNLVWLMLFSLPADNLNGQNTEAWTLTKCVETALRENIHRQVAMQQLAIATNNHHASMAGKYPAISFNSLIQGTIANQQNPASFINGIMRTGIANASVDASWVVFDGHRAQFNHKLLAKLEGQRQNNLMQSAMDVVREVTLAYYAAVWHESQVELNRKALTLSKEILDYQQDRQSLGAGTKQVVLQALDAVLQDSVNLTLAQLNSKAALLQLKLAMGIPGRDLVLATHSFDVVSERSRIPSKSDMLSRHPMILDARFQMEISEIQTRIRQAAWFPRLILNTGVVWSGNALTVDGNNPFTGEPFGTRTGTNRNAYASMAIQWPLYDGGMRRRQVQESKINETISRLQNQQIHNQLNTQFETMIATLEAQQTVIDLTGEQEINGQEQVRLAGERYRMGQMSMFEYRGIQLAWQQAAQRHLTGRYQYIVTITELRYLAGDLAR